MAAAEEEGDGGGGDGGSCWRRVWEFLRCRRTRSRGAEYVLLSPVGDGAVGLGPPRSGRLWSPGVDAVDLDSLDSFLRDNFSNLGVSAADLHELDRETEVIRHLLRLLPVYKKCLRRQARLDRLLSNRCRPHLLPAAEVERQKSRRVLETLDVVILKLLVGEFALGEDQSLEALLEKFSVDQSTLCEMERIAQLVDLDRENSRRLLDGGGATEQEALVALVRELEAAPPAPDWLPPLEDDSLAVPVSEPESATETASGSDSRTPIPVVAAADVPPTKPRHGRRGASVAVI